MLLNLALLLFQVLITITAQYKIKISDGLLSFEFLLGFFLYGVSFMCWVYLLKHNNFSFIMPLGVGITLVLSQLVGYYLLKEVMSIYQIVGVLLIITGAALVAYRA